MVIHWSTVQWVTLVTWCLLSMMVIMGCFRDYDPQICGSMCTQPPKICPNICITVIEKTEVNIILKVIVYLVFMYYVSIGVFFQIIWYGLLNYTKFSISCGVSLVGVYNALRRESAWSIVSLLPPKQFRPYAYDPIFLRGVSHCCRKNISTAPKKTAYLTSPNCMLSTNWNNCLHCFIQKSVCPTHPTRK